MVGELPTAITEDAYNPNQGQIIAPITYQLSTYQSGGSMTTAAQQYTERLATALAQGQAQHDPLDEDVSRYPEEVQGIIVVVCRLWHLRAPQTKVSKGLWIRDARELSDACGEFGLDALEAYRLDFEDYMTKHQGVAQHTVSGPGSLVKMVRAKTASMRTTPKRRRYDEGKYAEFIE